MIVAPANHETAYGCNELMFNPLRTWLWKSPFTPLFRKFMCSNIDIGSKVHIIAYIGTYYALGSAWLICLGNYIFVGLWNGYLDRAYVNAWQNWIAISVVFAGAGNLGLAVQRHRSGEKSFLPASKSPRIFSCSFSSQNIAYIF